MLEDGGFTVDVESSSVSTLRPFACPMRFLLGIYDVEFHQVEVKELKLFLRQRLSRLLLIALVSPKRFSFNSII